MLLLGCTSYWRWCALTRVSTCAAVNTCTKHKKQCSKGKLPIWSSKEGSDAENKKHGDEVSLLLHKVELLLLHKVALPLQEVALLPLHEVALLPLHEVTLLSIATRSGTTTSRRRSTQARQIRPSYLAHPESVESPALQHPALTEALKNCPTISNDLGC